MLREGVAWPYLKHKDYLIISRFSSNFNEVSFKVVKDNKTIYITEFVPVNEMLEELTETETYTLGNIQVNSDELIALIFTFFKKE